MLPGRVIVECNAQLDAKSHDPIPPPLPGRFIYALFTSGSTGKPKGVLLSHRAVLTIVRHFKQTMGIDSLSVALQTTPFTFDIHVTELYPFLLCGARVCLAPPDALTNFEKLSAFVTRQRPTHAQFVPSVASLYLAQHSLGASLTHLSIGGEAFPRELVPLIFRKHAAVHCFNWYGPTEAAVWASVFKVAPSDEGAGNSSLPIGRPIAERELYVVNGLATELCAVGETGELYIGGIGLAEYYVKDQVKTDAAFVHGLRTRLGLPESPEMRLYKTGDLAQWNMHGQIEFKGRVDWQVKINGLRIELGEIESVLRQVVGVGEAAVVVSKRKAIVAFTSGTATESELRDKCQSMLPPYSPTAQFRDPNAFPHRIMPSAMPACLRTCLPACMCPCAYVCAYLSCVCKRTCICAYNINVYAYVHTFAGTWCPTRFQVSRCGLVRLRPRSTG